MCFDAGTLSWRCMVCDLERLDSRISVVTSWMVRGEDQPHPIYFKQNIRHCNDNPSCIKEATTKIIVGHSRKIPVSEVPERYRFLDD